MIRATLCPTFFCGTVNYVALKQLKECGMMTIVYYLIKY